MGTCLILRIGPDLITNSKSDSSTQVAVYIGLMVFGSVLFSLLMGYFVDAWFCLKLKCVLISVWLQVSRTYEIFEALMEYERDVMSGNLSPSDIITVIISVNPVFEVNHQHRQAAQCLTFLQTLLSNNFCPELVPKVRSWFSGFLLTF